MCFCWFWVRLVTGSSILCLICLQLGHVRPQEPLGGSLLGVNRQVLTCVYIPAEICGFISALKPPVFKMLFYKYHCIWIQIQKCVLKFFKGDFGLYSASTQKGNEGILLADDLWLRPILQMSDFTFLFYSIPNCAWSLVGLWIGWVPGMGLLPTGRWLRIRRAQRDSRKTRTKPAGSRGARGKGNRGRKPGGAEGSSGQLSGKLRPSVKRARSLDTLCPQACAVRLPKRQDLIINEN